MTKKSISNAERGQILPDYVFAITVFLLGILLVLQIANGYMGYYPYQQTNEQNIRVNQAAIQTLIEQDSRTLNSNCAEDFFYISQGNTLSTVPDECSFTSSDTTLPQLLEVTTDFKYYIQITDLQGDLIQQNGVEFKTGDKPTTSEQIVISERYLQYEGSTVMVSVYTW